MDFKPPDSNRWTMDGTVIYKGGEFESPVNKRYSPIKSAGKQNVQGIDFKSIDNVLRSKIISLVLRNLGQTAIESIADAEYIYYYVDQNQNPIGVITLINDDTLSIKMQKRGWSKITSLGLRPGGIYLYNFCIEQDSRGLGIGKYLLTTVQNQTESGKVLRCQVELQNIVSLHIFKKCGFIEEDRIQNSDGTVLINLVYWSS